MVRSRGFEIIHYGIEGAESGANLQVDVMTLEEQESYIGKYDPRDSDFIGRHANAHSPLYAKFNENLTELLPQYAEKGDIILLPFGEAHNPALNVVQDCFFLESGIGYNQPFARFRVYESNAWLHHISGKEIGFNQQHVAMGNDYHWVIPNYYDLTEWPVKEKAGDYVLFMGRMMETKGLNELAEVAKAMPDVKFILAGTGDPTPFLRSPNMEFIGPVIGLERGELFKNAITTICPSRYIEPFCGVAVESMLCGTPALGSSFGAFTETIQHGETGFRCRTLGDWVSAIRITQGWGREDWTRTANYAREKYDMYKIAYQYEKTFNQIANLSGPGWFSLDNYLP